MLAAASRAGIGQRDMWPGSAVQVDSLARVSSSKKCRKLIVLHRHQL